MLLCLAVFASSEEELGGARPEGWFLPSRLQDRRGRQQLGGWRGAGGAGRALGAGEPRKRGGTEEKEVAEIGFGLFKCSWRVRVGQ